MQSKNSNQSNSRFLNAIAEAAKRIKIFFIRLVRQLKDIHNFLLFIAVVLVMTIPVWLLYLLGILFSNTILITIGTVYWAFWMGPMTPFFPLCIAIALGTRKIIDKFRSRKGLCPLSEVKIPLWEKLKGLCRKKSRKR